MGYTAHLLAEKIMERVDEYVSYYNNLRGQERLGWLTPLEYAGRLTAYLCGDWGPPHNDVESRKNTGAKKQGSATSQVSEANDLTDGLMDVPQVANDLRISRTSVYRLIEQQ